jgi:hypothetical protein
MAMLAIRGVYEVASRRRLNHGIGFDTAAIELILPTFGESLGLRGEICTHWALNPHPTLIPAIESGMGQKHSLLRRRARHGALHRRATGRFLHGTRRLAPFQSRVRADGRPLRDRPVHRIDLAARSRCEFVDGHARPDRRLRRGAEHGQRSPRPPARERLPWLALARGDDGIARGRKLVVQLVETFRASGVPTFVERLDAADMVGKAGLRDRARDDLRRRRHPRRDRRRRRLFVPCRQRRRSARGAGGDRRRHTGRHGAAGRSERRRCAQPESSPIPRPRRAARRRAPLAAWRRRRWPTSCVGRTTCTIRPPDSGAGDAAHRRRTRRRNSGNETRARRGRRLGKSRGVVRAAGWRARAIVVSTSVDGYEPVWRATLERFLERTHRRRNRDQRFRRDPAMVSLRLEQALELAR